MRPGFKSGGIELVFSIDCIKINSPPNSFAKACASAKASATRGRRSRQEGQHAESMRGGKGKNKICNKISHAASSSATTCSQPPAHNHLLPTGRCPP